MQYSEEIIEKLVAIAEEKGEYAAVANYLGISQSQLLTKRRQYPKFDIALKEAIKRHLDKQGIPKDYKFSKEELEEITETVRDFNVDQAGKKYGLGVGIFFNMRKSNPELDAAIIKGQDLRKNSSPFKKAMELFATFGSKELSEMTEVAENGGLEAVLNKYGFSTNVLTRCRRELPELEAAIKAGLKQRPIGAAISGTLKEKKERKVPKPYKRKAELRKPPREIINTTLLTIEENTAEAWANFRKMVEERKDKSNLKKVSNGYYRDIIGV